MYHKISGLRIVKIAQKYNFFIYYKVGGESELMLMIRKNKSINTDFNVDSYYTSDKKVRLNFIKLKEQTQDTEIEIADTYSISILFFFNIS